MPRKKQPSGKKNILVKDGYNTGKRQNRPTIIGNFPVRYECHVLALVSDNSTIAIHSKAV
jgi:hypothetical protein